MDPVVGSDSKNPSQLPTAPIAVIVPAGTLYKDAAEGLKAVERDYLYWTGKLTETSLQLSYALIAANWAVFGTVAGILNHGWSRWSVFTVFGWIDLQLLRLFD